MAKRKSNKQVKAMICGIFDKKRRIPHPFGHFYGGCDFMVCFINGFGPDEYYEDIEPVLIGEQVVIYGNGDSNWIY